MSIKAYSQMRTGQSTKKHGASEDITAEKETQRGVRTEDRTINKETWGGGGGGGGRQGEEVILFRLEDIVFYNNTAEKWKALQTNVEMERGICFLLVLI